MNKLLNKFISGLSIGEEQIVGRLRIKPLINTNSDFARAEPLKTLDEAISDDLLEITEIDTGGSVPELLVKNLGKSDVIILEGETVIGGKQNRCINSTFIIPADAEIVIPVSCVERGRWHFNSNRFASGGSVLYPSLRARSHRSVSSNLYSTREYRSDQRDIWSDIYRKRQRMRVSSPTDAMHDIENATLGPQPESDLRARIAYHENQVGFLAFVDEGFAGGDIFGSSELCEKQFGKLLKGYYLDALDRDLQFPELTSDEIMSEIAESDEVRFAALGKGEENRFETAKLTGAWKSVDGGIATVTVFPRAGSETPTVMSRRSNRRYKPYTNTGTGGTTGSATSRVAEMENRPSGELALQIDIEEFLRANEIIPVTGERWNSFEIGHYSRMELANEDDRLNRVRQTIPRGVGGVYIYEAANGECLYIGKSVNVRDRFRTHFQRAHKRDPSGDRHDRHFDFWSNRTGELTVRWRQIDREVDRQIVEIMLSHHLKPAFQEPAE